MPRYPMPRRTHLPYLHIYNDGECFYCGAVPRSRKLREAEAKPLLRTPSGVDSYESIEFKAVKR